MGQTGPGSAREIPEVLRSVLLVACTTLVLLAPVKFGNPAAPAQQTAFPLTAGEWMRAAWPSDLAVLAGWLLGLGAVAAVLVRRRWGVPSVPFILFLCWILWEIVCGPFAESGPAWATAVRYHLSILGFWYALIVVSEDPRSRLPLAAALLVAVLIASVRALQQRGWEIEETRRFAVLYQDRLFGPEGMPDAFRSKLSSLRAWGTFVYPNALAGFIGVGLPAAAVAAWATFRRRGRGIAYGAALFAGAMGIAALFCTESKAGVAAATLGWGTAGLVLVRRRSIRVLWAVAVAALIAGVVLTAFLAPRRALQQRVATLASRGEYWRAALRLTAESPLVGVGPGAFGIAYLRVKEPGAEEAAYAHSLPLQAAAEGGVPGGVLITAALWAGWILLLRLAGGLRGVSKADRPPGETVAAAFSLAAAGAAGAFAVHGLFDFDMEIPGIAFPAVGFLAWLPAPPAARLMRSRWVSTVAWIVLAVVAVGAVHSSLRRVRSEQARARAFEVLRQNPRRAYAWAADATEFGPALPLAWEARGRAAEAADDPAAAAAAYARAAALEPTRARFHYHHGEAAALIPGREKEAWAAFERAARLYPTNPEYQDALRGP